MEQLKNDPEGLKKQKLKEKEMQNKLVLMSPYRQEINKNTLKQVQLKYAVPINKDSQFEESKQIQPQVKNTPTSVKAESKLIRSPLGQALTRIGLNIGKDTGPQLNYLLQFKKNVIPTVPTEDRIDEADDERDTNPIDITSAPSKSKLKSDEQGQDEDIPHKITK